MDSIINQPPIYLFSEEKMPFTEHKNKGQVKWFSTDKEKKYKEQPSSVFSQEDIVYQFNSHGYRCPEFEERQNCDSNTIHVVSLGASETFGLGLPEDKSYPYIVAKLLENYLKRPVMNWNVSLVSASADYLARLLVSALPILKPEIVLLQFPPAMSRREYISETGKMFLCLPGALQKKINNIVNPEKAAILKGYKQLSSSYNDVINFYKNYEVCESLCKKYGVMWLFSASNTGIFTEIKHLIQTDNLIEPGIGDLKNKYKYNPATGLARDMIHPGIKPNEDMAEAFFLGLKNVYSSRLESLKL